MVGYGHFRLSVLYLQSVLESGSFEAPVPFGYGLHYGPAFALATQRSIQINPNRVGRFHQFSPAISFRVFRFDGEVPALNLPHALYSVRITVVVRIRDGSVAHSWVAFSGRDMTFRQELQTPFDQCGRVLVSRRDVHESRNQVRLCV